MNDLITSVKNKQKEIQELQKEATRKAGRKEQLLKQLSENFQVASKDEAFQLVEEYKKVKDENNQLLENIDKELGQIIANAKSSTVSKT